jgi:sugar lactone lactonase YvrE
MAETVVSARPSRDERSTREEGVAYMASVRTRLWLVLGVVVALALVAPAVAMAVPTYVTSYTGGGLTGPTQVAVDGYGNVFVGGLDSNSIVEYNATGGVVRSFNNNGTGTMFGPEGVYVSGIGDIYVTEYWGDRVDQYTNAGVHIRQIGLGSGSGNGNFSRPADVKVDRYGFIWVNDNYNHRMQVFKPDGTYARQFAFNSSDFRYGFCIDAHDNIYIANYTANRVEKYTSAGAFVTQWSVAGGPLDVDIGPDGNLVVPAQADVKAYTPSGGYLYTLTSGFAQAWGAATDGLALYVADRSNNRVTKWTLPSAKPTVRVGGYDRYAVAVNLAQQRWPGYVGMKHVIVVCGEDRAIADPMASAGLAGIWDAPILLTTTGYLFPTTKTALQQIRAANGPLTVHVIGGTASVPASVFNAIKACNPGGTTERIDGRDRYVLSANIAARAADEAASRGITVPGVLIFNAENSGAFYDALCASVMSAHNTMPMIAVQKNKVPSSASWVLAYKFLGKPRVVVNSATYVPASTYSSVGAWARMSNVADPKASAVQINTFGRVWGFTPLTNVGLAAKLPDALTGGTFLGLEGGVISYTDKAPLSAATSNFVTVAKPGTFKGYVFGSNKSVADSTFTQFSNALNTP